MDTDNFRVSVISRLSQPTLPHGRAICLWAMAVISAIPTAVSLERQA